MAISLIQPGHRVRGYHQVEDDGGAVVADRDIDNFVLGLEPGSGR